MLIKIVTLTGDIHIIEDVTDVSVMDKPQTYAPYRKTPEETFNEVFDRTETFFFDHLGQRIASTADEYECRVIEYAKDGPCRLYIANLAYICNNEGRTIEKVVAGPKVV